MRRTAIVHQGALGDFVLSLPVYAGLHSLEPELRIHFWSKPAHARLLAEQPYFGDVTSCDSPDLNAFYLASGWQSIPVAPVLAQADAVFWFGQENSRVVAERLEKRLKKPVHWIQSFPDPPGRTPVSDFLIQQVRAIGYPIPYSLPCLPMQQGPGRDRAAEAQTGPARTTAAVLLHPGSGGRTKIWPLARWAALSARILDAGHPITLVLGPADRALLPFAEAMQDLGCSLRINPELPQLAALIQGSRLLVGNDSGVSHLAAALGVCTVVVFGPASPAIWQPRGPKVQVISDRWDAQRALTWPAVVDAGEIDPVNTVAAAVFAFLNSSEEGRPGPGPSQ